MGHMNSEVGNPFFKVYCKFPNSGMEFLNIGKFPEGGKRILCEHVYILHGSLLASNAGCF